MPRKKKTQAEHEHTHLSLRIEDFKVRATAGINHYAHSPQYAWRDTDEEPLYEFGTNVEIKAVCTNPDSRAGQPYEITIYSEGNQESYLYYKLKDVQAVDEHRSPQYRTYRGKQVPIYRAPLGMGSLQKERGGTRWQGSIFAQPRYVTDVLILLGHQRQLYLAIHERKVARDRWIQSIAVQTTDPAEE
jgi:hypothetical protein